eukprot:scaffold36015_cov68-Phaeocystis_antarctica.AAC.2
MIDTALHLPTSFLHEAFSNRSGVPLDSFELYYRGKRLEGKAALSSWGVEKDSTIEVKMRGRGGMPRLGNSPSDHRSGLQSSRPEGGAGAEATLASETAAAASAASSTGAQEGAGILRSALSRTPSMMTWGKSRSGERALLSAEGGGGLGDGGGGEGDGGGGEGEGGGGLGDGGGGEGEGGGGEGDGGGGEGDGGGGLGEVSAPAALSPEAADSGAAAVRQRPRQI